MAPSSGEGAHRPHRHASATGRRRHAPRQDAPKGIAFPGWPSAPAPLCVERKTGAGKTAGNTIEGGSRETTKSRGLSAWLRAGRGGGGTIAGPSPLSGVHQSTAIGATPS